MKRKMKYSALLICSFALFSACIQVQSDEVGVRVFNIYKGVERKAKTTGTYLYIPVLFNFYILPKTEQKLEMVEPTLPAITTLEEEAKAALPSEGEQRSYELDLERIEKQMKKIEEVQVIPHKLAEDKNNIRLKTSDGNDVWVDVVVVYQVIEKLAPVLVQRVGIKIEDIEDLVSTMTRGEVRAVLGELKTEEFYRAEIREEKLKEVFELLNKKLNPFGIQVNSLSLFSFRFLPEYEDLLREKAMAEQKRQEFEQLQLAAEQEKKAKFAKAKGDADAMIAIAEGKKRQAELEGEALFYSQSQQAEGLRQKLLLEAEGISARTQALTGPGGDKLVAREIMRVLEGKTMFLLPESGMLNLLDINELFQTYGAFKEEKSK